jgi:hypothetical protein
MKLVAAAPAQLEFRPITQDNLVIAVAVWPYFLEPVEIHQSRAVDAQEDVGTAAITVSGAVTKISDGDMSNSVCACP